MGRRKKRGVLTSLAPPRGKSRPPRSRVRRVLMWAVGIVGFGAIVAVMALFAVLSFSPSLDARPGEADVVVEKIDDQPVGFPPGVAAAAGVTLEHHAVLVPLTKAQRGDVAVGSWLHVRYTYYSRTGGVRVDDWRIVPP
jgi:hypothetical protein